jgi:glycosyltransferase involved in cell wall biosynthesis
MKSIVYSALSPHALKQIEKIKTTNVLVGVPSYNNAHTINYVVYQAAKGLKTHFPNKKSAIFVSDGNSTDGTLETVKGMRLPFEVPIITATYIGVSGKGSAVKAIFEAANALNAKAVALLDSDLRSITPDWIRLLISPILTGTGFVTPFYVRHKYDGTITNFLCYPITSSLYGKKIRQPIGGDFGLSIELVKKLLKSQLWQTPYVPRFGVDIFETHTALAEKFDVKQAFLGSKVHEAKDPGANLGPMFKQVVGSMFTCIERYEKVWKEIHGSHNVEIVGQESRTGTPEPIELDLQNLTKMYKSGFKNNRKIYQTVLTRDLFKKIEKLKETNTAEAPFSPETWAKTVFSFVASFKNEKQFTRENLLEALRILWIGKVAVFLKETLEVDTFEAEKKIEEEVKAFENMKPFLIDALTNYHHSQ